MRINSFALLLSAGVLMCSVASASEAIDGDTVIVAVDQHEDGYTDLKASVTMTLQSESGKKRKRQLKIYALEKQPLGDLRKFVFESPADVAGTSVLIDSRVIESDAQWIFLPAFKRVKRISGSNKTTRFVGSEFTYEDLSSQELEKYKNVWLGTTEINGKVCDIIERIPGYKNSAYKKLIAYVDVEHRRFRRIEYFNAADELVKTQVLANYKLYDNRYWLANTMTMTNHQTKKITTMEWVDIELKTDMESSEFSVSALKRAR